MAVLCQLITQGNGIAIAGMHVGKGLGLDISGAADYIKNFSASNRRKFKAAHTFPNVNQDFWIRYWFAAGGVDPDQDIDLLAVPSAETVQGMRNGTMDAFSTGDPWPYRIVADADASHDPHWRHHQQSAGAHGSSVSADHPRQRDCHCRNACWQGFGARCFWSCRLHQKFQRQQRAQVQSCLYLPQRQSRFLDPRLPRYPAPNPCQHAFRQWQFRCLG